MFSGVVRCADSGKPLAGIVMSDGKNVVKTDENGHYVLPGWEKAHLIFANVLTKSHDDWYQSVEEGKVEYDFSLRLAEQTEDHSFIHLSDTEIGSPTEIPRGPWLGFMRDFAKERGAGFIMHGGDISGVAGMNEHCAIMNYDTMDLPVRYCQGNHDFIGEEYGEELYEQLYGPVWYSFDMGNIHYMVTSMLYGDVRSAFTHEDQWNWIRADLSLKDPDKGLVIFNHACCATERIREHNRGNEFTFDWEKKNEEMLYANGYRGIFFGHLHLHYHGLYKGAHFVCTAHPKGGGIDSSPTGIRLVKVSADQTISSEIAIYDQRKFTAAGDCIKWVAKLPGGVLHSTPVVYDGCMYLGINDDGFPKTCGVVCLSADGKIRWFYQTQNSVKNEVAVENGTVYALDSDGCVYALDAQSGQLKWVQNVPFYNHFYTHSSVAVYKGKVFAGCCRQMSALDAATGEVIWNGEPSDGGEACPYRPVFYKDLMIQCGCWYNIYALDIHTGKKVWEVRDLKAKFFYATPLVEGDTLIVPSNTKIILMDAATGEVQRYVEMGAFCMDTSSQPVRDGDVYYVGTVTNGVLALNAETFEIMHHYPVGKSLVFTSGYSRGDKGTVDGHIRVDGPYIRFAASDGYFYTYQKQTALLVSRQKIGASSFVAPTAFADGWAVADVRGNVTVFEDLAE